MANGRFDCTGEVVPVTGGDGGIGPGLARTGGEVAIRARDAARNAAAAAKRREAGAPRAAIRRVDVADEGAVVAGGEALLAGRGRVDRVFAAAARASRSRSVLTLGAPERPDVAVGTAAPTPVAAAEQVARRVMPLA